MSTQSIISKTSPSLLTDVFLLFNRLGKAHILDTRFKLGKGYDRSYFLMAQHLERIIQRDIEDLASTEDDDLVLLANKIREQLNLLILNCK